MKKIPTTLFKFAVVGLLGGMGVFPGMLLFTSSIEEASGGNWLALWRVPVGLAAAVVAVGLPLYFILSYVGVEERCPKCGLEKNKGWVCKSCGAALPNPQLAFANVARLTAAVVGGFACLAQFALIAHAFFELERFLKVG